MAFNLTTEYLALKDHYQLTELPTLDSLQRRIGASEEFNAQYAEHVEWGRFLKEQFYRLGGLSLPALIVEPLAALHENPKEPSGPYGIGVVVLGVVISVVCLALALFPRPRALLVALVVSGFIWALAFRYAVAFHEFMILYSIGIPLLFYSSAMSHLHRLFGRLLAIVLAAAAALVFVVSTVQVSGIGHDAEAARFHETLIADFERIRHVTEPDDRIFVPVPRKYLVPFAGATSAVNFYLSGRVIGYRRGGDRDLSRYDFVLARPLLEIRASASHPKRRDAGSGFSTARLPSGRWLSVSAKRSRWSALSTMSISRIADSPTSRRDAVMMT